MTEATINSELKVQTDDFADDRAQRWQATLMAEWVTQTDRFLDFNERTLLSGSGSVSADRMRQVAAQRYAEFDQHRRTLEAERATAAELDDFRALTEIENRRAGPEGDEDGHQPR
ncbi:MAG: virulence RhuM family protein [Acidobacteria bacterium]|nr:virulence RhuM family protein [Acidobacteriota bacterium]